MFPGGEDPFWEGEPDDPISNPLRWIGYSFIGAGVIIGSTLALFALMQVIVWIL